MDIGLKNHKSLIEKNSNLKKVQSGQKCWQLRSSMEITTQMLLLTVLLTTYEYTVLTNVTTFGQAVKSLSLSSVEIVEL